jgi:guanosine-3',5'-bis(diphosphate) 3'-pyrophosphohydrolase
MSRLANSENARCFFNDRDVRIGMSNISNLLESIAFAADRHRNQRRKDADASPYINHPIALATLLATTGGIDDQVVLQAAVLHDTIEDTETTYQDLLNRFGEAVASVVAEVTDDKALAKSMRKEFQVEHAPYASREAALVKLADKICNLRDMANAPPAGWPLERRREYFDWAKRVVKGLPATSAELQREFDAAYALRP